MINFQLFEFWIKKNHILKGEKMGKENWVSLFLGNWVSRFWKLKGCLSVFLTRNDERSHATVLVTHRSFGGDFFVFELIKYFPE